MNSAFGEVFLFLTNLAWKSRLTIPVLVTTVFLVMDIRLQIEINIQSGQVAAAELEQLDDSDDDDFDEYTTDGSENEEEGEDDTEAAAELQDSTEEEAEYGNTANRLRRSLGLS